MRGRASASRCRTRGVWPNELSRDVALKTMQSEVEKGWWDPKLVAAFERLMRDGKGGG